MPRRFASEAVFFALEFGNPVFSGYWKIFRFRLTFLKGNVD